MATGVVSFYNQSKGFGLIKPDTGGPSLFMHSSALGSPNTKVMATQRVQFDVTETTNGLTATKIKLLS